MYVTNDNTVLFQAVIFLGLFLFLLTKVTQHSVAMVYQ